MADESTIEKIVMQPLEMNMKNRFTSVSLVDNDKHIVVIVSDKNKKIFFATTVFIIAFRRLD